MRRRSLAAGAVAAAGAFAAVAGLVAAGTLTRLDQWAIDHAMPVRPGTRPGPTVAETVVPLLHARWSSVVGDVANVVTLPAQPVLSTAAVAACCLALRRRGRGRAAAGFAAAWIAANAVEVLCKSVLTRPPLYRDGVHVRGFDASFPSGHGLRTVLLAATVAAAWPPARWPLAAWALASAFLLELGAFHTASDVVAGVLLGLAAAATTAWWSSRPSSSSSTSSSARP